MATSQMIEKADARAKKAAEAREQTRKPTLKHDNLHMGSFPNQKACHCMCPRCWMPTGKGKGTCVCEDCPCSKRYVPLGSAIPPKRRVG